MALKPLTYGDLLFQLLRDANIKKFNARKSANPTVPPIAICYLDVRGLDAALTLAIAIFAPLICTASTFPKPRSPGRSLNGARISSALFPADLAAEVIALSVDHGAWLGYDK